MLKEYNQKETADPDSTAPLGELKEFTNIIREYWNVSWDKFEFIKLSLIFKWKENAFPQGSDQISYKVSNKYSNVMN